jgi:carbamoyltransferase
LLKLKRPKYVLGIACHYHDASACLIKDGRIIAAAEEERFTRKKHDFDFPKNAVKYVLSEAGISMKRLDAVGFYEKPILKFERILNQHIEMFPMSFWTFYKAMPVWINDKLRVERYIRKMGYPWNIYFIPHHMSHAASSFFMSPFKEAAVLTVDGVGEWDTTTLGIAKGKDITLLKTIEFPHSLGLLYSTVTAYLGFKVNNSEYKVMGMAPYGRPRYVDRFRRVIDIRDDGSFKLNMKYFVFHYKMRMPSRRFIKLFGPARKPNTKLTQHHKDIAASLQKITEEVVFKMLNHLYRTTKLKKLVMAGGVALNSVANGKILQNTPFEDVYIVPPAGDGGTSLGVASYVYFNILKNRRTNDSVLRSAYLGPGFSTEEIKSFLNKNKIKFHEFKNKEELLKIVATLIWKNKVIGWFQGRMEFGPRALGSRSILSNPCNPKMQDILNLKVKHREKFRPFAPVVTLEDAPKIFECDRPIPIPTDFMLMVYPIKKEWRKKLPAVTHVDGSGRLQTIRREQNPLYYDLIKEFEKLSGVPVLINTSFNIRGEPIVATPLHAYRCMMGTGIDFLVIDKFLVKRDENAQHIWDSEEYAKD